MGLQRSLIRFWPEHRLARNAVLGSAPFVFGILPLIEGVALIIWAFRVRA